MLLILQVKVCVLIQCHFIPKVFFYIIFCMFLYMYIKYMLALFLDFTSTKYVQQDPYH